MESDLAPPLLVPNNAPLRVLVQAERLLGQRDDYMRRRIDATLPDGGVGLLFVGLTHHVDEGLPSDIDVSYLIHDLPFHRGGDIEGPA